MPCNIVVLLTFDQLQTVRLASYIGNFFSTSKSTLLGEFEEGI